MAQPTTSVSTDVSLPLFGNFSFFFAFVPREGGGRAGVHTMEKHHYPVREASGTLCVVEGGLDPPDAHAPT